MWPNFGKLFIYALSWISRNTDSNYSKYYSLLLLDSSHVRFAPEIEWGNSYHSLVYIATGWTSRYWKTFWTQPAISWIPCIRGWVGVRRVWRVKFNDASRHSQPSCVHRGPDRWPQQRWLYHKPSRHTVEHNWIPSYPINAPKWPHSVCFGPSWLDRVDKRLSVKVDLIIYSSFVTVSGHCNTVWLLCTYNK